MFSTYHIFGTNNETYIEDNDNYLAITGDGNKVSVRKCRNCISYGTNCSDSICLKRWYAPTIIDAGGCCNKFKHFCYATKQDKLSSCKKLLFAIQGIKPYYER